MSRRNRPKQAIGTAPPRIPACGQALDDLKVEAWDSLDTDAARLIDLRGEPSLQPVSRRMGTELPGFAAGWFRLRNGSKALIQLTERTRVVHIPTRNGYDLLLSPQRPEAMISELRERARR